MAFQISHFFLVSLALFFFCLLEKSFAIERTLEGRHHLVQISSLLPSTSCSSSTKGSKTKASLDVLHKHGPCSQLNGKAKIFPTHSDILDHDKERVNYIHSKLLSSKTNLEGFMDSKSKSKSIKSRKSANLPAKSGSLIGSGNYFVVVGLGTPKKDLSLIFDTGSDLTWTQCQPCVGSCYKQQDEIFDPSKSTTYYNITCTSSDCTQLSSATEKKRYIQMAPRSDNISEISPVKESWSIVVRIVRAWFVRDVNRDAHPFSLDMVLMDASGNKIHATVRRTLIYKFEKDLQEGKVYSMSGFGVAANIGSYRTTKHEYKLNFQFNTKVKLCGKNGVPSDIYPISNPIDVFNSEYDTDYLVDVMGMLTGVGTQREYGRNGTKTKMVAMELDYDGFKFKVTLFGQYAEELNAFVAAGETDNVVVVVLLAKVKIWQGAATVQNTIYSTKLIFNPDLIAAHDLKKRMVGKNSVPSPGIAILQDPSRITEEDDFLKITPRKTVEDLKECTMESCFVVKATVKFVIDTDEWWWYTACVCNKKVVPDEKMYFCSKCNKHVMHVCPRYMIKVRVIDETDSATFVIFDRDAALLLKKTAADMIESMGSDESETLPKEISSLVESTFLFKVETNISTDARFEKSYRVRRISNDVELLKKFTAVPTEATVVEGSFEAVENAENDSSVNQNLLKKLGDSEVVGTKDVDAKKAVDLTSDEVDVAPAKRSCPFEGEGSGGNGPVKLLKNIKVEKD